MKKVKKFIRKIKSKFSQKYYFVSTVREEKKQYKDGAINALTGEDISGQDYSVQDSRCWGFFKSKKEAIKAVEENWTDMNEAGYYQWAVIEPHYEGLVSQDFSEDTLWFKEDYCDINIKDLYDKIPEDLREKAQVNTKTGRITWKQRNDDGLEYWTSNFNGYKQCETPEFAKHTCGWTIS